VVLQNLRNSFPEKADKEIKTIARAFYHNLCDFMVETFKILTISKKGILKRCKFTPESFTLFQKYADEGKSVIMVMGHVGNWEWAGHPFSLLCKQKLVVIYHPLTNKRFDKLMFDMRSRFGTKMIQMKTAFKDILVHRKDITCNVFISDQTPMPEAAYWTTFLNQDTPVFKGTEVIAKKLNMPIVYACVKKIKRGYYEMYAETLVENPASTAEGEISEMHTRRLEKDIIAAPESWLWSHRRWKYKRPIS
jgi:KDO2-lipid IV(A) lauroyltransferase